MTNSTDAGDGATDLPALASQAPEVEPVAWMPLAMAAADLNTATDGIEKLRPYRVAVLRALHRLATQPKAGGEDAVLHWSDCAVHNEPTSPSGPCDCGGYSPTIAWRKLALSAIEDVVSACRETNWGTPTFGPDAGEVLEKQAKMLDIQHPLATLQPDAKDGEIARLQEALRRIANTDRHAFTGPIAHSDWCRDEARQALAAKP